MAAKRVLVVDDERLIVKGIRFSLEQDGMQVDCAYDGEEALEYAKSLEVPVIFLTAKGKTNDKVRGLKAGADDYITKPFEIAELLARVESVLRRYQKVQKEVRVGNGTLCKNSGASWRKVAIEK